MIYLRCFLYEMAMRIIAWVVMDPIDDRCMRAVENGYYRGGPVPPSMVHHPLITRTYRFFDGLYQRAWDSLWDARPELEEALSKRFPEI
jgi:hypothetical protein